MAITARYQWALSLVRCRPDLSIESSEEVPGLASDLFEVFGTKQNENKFP